METIKAYAAIIGGGASGLMCACIASKRHPNEKIVVIEKDNRVGKKIHDAIFLTFQLVLTITTAVLKAVLFFF